MASGSTDFWAGQRLKKARLLHSGMTVQHAAAFVGVSDGDYLAMEAGQLRPTADQIMWLADLMGVLPSWFFEDLSKSDRSPDD